MNNSRVRMIETILASFGERIVVTSYERVTQLNGPAVRSQYSRFPAYPALITPPYRVLRRMQFNFISLLE